MNEALISQLLTFGPALSEVASDENGIKEACEANLWFTPGMVRTALLAAAPWFEPETLSQFLSSYPAAGTLTGKTGLILAGNIPAAGLHDLVIALAAGGEVVVKLSPKDNQLLTAVVSHIHPELKGRISFVSELGKRGADRFIATGSNNASRYFEHEFGRLPHLIRRNRFSVAWIPALPEKSLFASLLPDLFLYCGMGCRNAGTLIVTGEKETILNPLTEVIQRFPSNFFPAAWHDLVRWEKSLAEQRGEKFIDAGNALIKFSDALRPAGPGIIQIWEGTEVEANERLASHKHDIQCIIGKDVRPGESQFPAIHEFADGVDTLAWLLTGIDG